MMGMVELIGLLLIILSSFFLYVYIAHREKEQGKNKKYLLFVALTALMSIGTAVYGRYVNEYSAMQLYLNIGVLFLLAAMTWVDYKEKIIPNQLILVGLIIWVIEIAVEIFAFSMEIKTALLFSALGGCLWGGILLIVALIAKNGLGMGDVKMFFVIGLIYGMNNTYSIILISLLIMAITSIILLLLKKVDRKTAVPMAPFTLIGFILCIFLGM